MNDISKEYESSLKSIETENSVDKAFYRPLGFRIARLLKNTGITPNMITILSIFVGAGAGLMFYHPYNIAYAIYGILFLVAANILDCVDGQLARMTGIKSEIGRILDGFAGDIWFLCIYIAFAMRSIDEYGSYWFIALAVLSTLSHLVQAAVTDYYKTLHLFFVSKEKGKEFESYSEVLARYEQMPSGINKFFSYFYIGYTRNQEFITPKLQALLANLKATYGENIPESVRLAFREKSKKLMFYIDFMTFNGRTLAMFAIVLTGQVWLYFLFEIIFLNIILVYVVKKHEKMCLSFIK